MSPHPQNRTGWIPWRVRPRRPTSSLTFPDANYGVPTGFPVPHKPSRFAWIVFASSRPPRSLGFLQLHSSLSTLFQDQALDRLVSPSCMCYHTSTDDLSTLSSSRGLTRSRDGNSLLWGGFTLRCLQRLSLPHFASLLCRWHDNSCTRGASIPVLSY